MSIKSSKIKQNGVVVSVRLNDKTIDFIDLLCKLEKHNNRSKIIQRILNCYRLEYLKNGNK